VTFKWWAFWEVLTFLWKGVVGRQSVSGCLAFSLPNCEQATLSYNAAHLG
jgi:hypothetical protein